MNISTITNVPQPRSEDVERGEKIRKFAKTSDALKTFNRKFDAKRVEIYPGFFSDDPRLPFILKDLSEFKLVSGSRTKYGLYMGPHPGAQLDRARAIAGSLILPLSFSEKREEGSEKSSGLYKFCKMVTETIFSRRKRFYGRISKQSGVGFPFCAHSLEFKKHLMLKVLKNLGLIFDAIRKDDLTRLFELDVLFLSNTQIRRQTDAYNRRRDIILFESTREKPLTLHDVRPLNAMCEDLRTRVVYAMSWVPNIIGTIFGHGYREFMDEQYAATFKHRGPLDVSAKIQKAFDELGDDFYAASLDYSRYDTSMPLDAIDGFIAGFPLPEEIKKMMRLQLFAPHFCSNDGRGKRLCDGDPLDITTFTFYRGLPSGVWFTSSVGKIVNISFVISCLVSCGLMSTGPDGLPRKEDVIAFLQHRHLRLKVFCLNMGDDMIVMGRRDQVMRLLKTMESSGTFDVSTEDGVTFLGYSYFLDGTKVKYQLSLASYIIGELIPERSITDPVFRPYGPLGLHLREAADIYGSNVQFEEFKQFKLRVIRKHLGIELDELLLSKIEQPHHLAEIGSNLSSEQQRMISDILADPSKVLWKYGDKELATIKSVVDTFSQAILPDVVEPFINKFL